ncbi:hypothetical protein DFP72DRAFT_1170981 [Ephemerocybe angulata]|uniref:Thioredoxin-like protein AAED1 n=1 Tax=Ephemerocybe angulata TaxID=980116 RepID=A0A8H6M2I7_9AGAR|nr:hypothetical protein DFP72DRAFT_1170981 [Tulosesus angulatus]
MAEQDPNQNAGDDPKALPTPETLAAAAALDIYDADGAKVKFGSLFEDQSTKTLIVVFIRHFFCGACHAYVESISSTSQAAFEESNTKVAVIGCGDHAAIRPYRETSLAQSPSSSSFTFYTDPTRTLFHTLGMTYCNLDRTPAGQPTPAYLGPLGFMRRLGQALWRGPVKNPSMIGKHGNEKQNGGEFVFGPGMECRFASRMRHTEDHVPVEELLQAAGVHVH